MDLQQNLTRAYLSRLVQTPEGRAHVLSQCAEAEDNGESRLFDRLLARVEDTELQRLIQRHQADEVRHGKLFRECAERSGAPVLPVPEHLQIIERINGALNGLFDRPITSHLDVMEVYLLLQVLEERAVTQFPLMEEAFRPVDPKTADTFLAVANDEARHLRYCHAISKRYAPDQATLEGTLRRFREVEAKAFAENSQANMAHTLAHHYAAVGPVERMFWRSVGAASWAIRPAQPTLFGREPIPAAA